MNKIDVGEIRRITVGDIKNGFSFTVGQTLHIGKDDVVIDSIVRDENNYYFFNTIRYIIYVKKGEDIFVWNTFENYPVRVECSI